MNTGTKLVIAAIIAAAAIAVPLLLKSGDDSGNKISLTQVSTETVQTAEPLPRFVDFGTTYCAPCRVMLEVMAVLEQNYPDTLQVEFINVQQDEKSLGLYEIKIIPTQIFYSPDGRELFRHVGVMSAEDVVSKWKSLGYDITVAAEGV